MLGNIALYIPKLAKEFPDKVAIRHKISGVYKDCSFASFNRKTNTLANGLQAEGLVKGDRVIMLIKHTLEFYLVTFTLFKMGVVPVIIDPGMKKKDLLKCIKQADAKALIAIPIGHIIKAVFFKAFSSCKIQVTVGRKGFWKGKTINELLSSKNNQKPFPTENVVATDLAAILFTSGSTGVPKGVEYEHGIFENQLKSIQEIYQLKPEDTDIPCFPLLGLFSLGIGITLILPDMDPSKPAKVNPMNIIGPIQEMGITNCFASPAVWHKISKYCDKNSIQLPSLKKAITAGAPVRGDILRLMIDNILPDDGDMYTPYGATESLPVTSINGRSILEETQMETDKGKGTCVGHAVAGVEIRIITISDEPIASFSDTNILPQGDIGEIVVSSSMITKRYFQDDEKTRGVKILEGEKLWHRIGDVGYLDAVGKLWFCGRKDHRVEYKKSGKQETLFTINCEAIFNNHPKVFRTALVGIHDDGEIKPAIIVELENDFRKLNKQALELLAQELFLLGQKESITIDIHRLYYYRDLPVDVRHNSKINRAWLRNWAQRSKKKQILYKA
ncbi:MAG: AMP-binding protein [Bacteroidales bacterium]|nr:AMP-binding protein [Bacteroidales bacterium]